MSQQCIAHADKDPLKQLHGNQSTEMSRVTIKGVQKKFLVVIPKEGLAGSSPAKPSFGTTRTIELGDKKARLKIQVRLPDRDCSDDE